MLTYSKVSHFCGTPPPSVRALDFFRDFFLDYWGCLVRGETDLVKYWEKFDQNNVNGGG